MESVEKIAEAVLYEGYLLYPYRRSAIKNRQRWTFGGVYPRQHSQASGGDDPWRMQTQCLVVGDRDTAIAVKVRFLHVADRRVGTYGDGPGAGELRFVEGLRVDGRVYRPWEEAIEREIPIGATQGDLTLGDLLRQCRQVAIDVPGGRDEESLVDAAGQARGALVREWQPVQGVVEITAEPLQQGEEADHPVGAPDGHSTGSEPGTPAATGQATPSAPGERRLYRLTVRIANTTPWTPPDKRSEMQPGGARPTGGSSGALIRQTFISTHTILHVEGGDFISLLEPPAAYQAAAESCTNVKTWPVLVGDQGERHTLLSSPIILYDYPRIAPESPGNLFDATEIDELLTLSIMTLSDEEKQEMRESDARGREILERTEALSTEQLMKLHGAIRSLQPVRKEER